MTSRFTISCISAISIVDIIFGTSGFLCILLFIGYGLYKLEIE
jgi:hypothetical protein